MLTLNRIIQSLFTLCQAVKYSPLKNMNNKLYSKYKIYLYLIVKIIILKKKNVMKYFLQHVLITLNQINMLPPINVSINIVYCVLVEKRSALKM